MFRISVFVYADDACRVDGEVVVLVESDSLWRTVDIDAFQVAVGFYDALAGVVVGVAACFTIVGQDHQAIFLVPIQFTGGVQAVIGDEYRIAVGIVFVALVADLRRRGRMIAVVVQVSVVVRGGRYRIILLDISHEGIGG